MKLTEIISLILLLFALQTNAQSGYRLQYNFVLKDSSIKNEPKLNSKFADVGTAKQYINELPKVLQSKGFIAASIDSTQLGDSLGLVWLYLGPHYEWLELSLQHVPSEILRKANIDEKDFAKKEFNLFAYQSFVQAVVRYYENTGYPFAKVFLDSVSVLQNRIQGMLKVDTIAGYKIDSMRIIGKARLSSRFLQNYLNIKNGSPYSAEKIQGIDDKLNQLKYVSVQHPSDVMMVGTGATVNLYLQPKKSSLFNFLVGLAPMSSSTNKFMFTYDINLDLNNLFGNGEGLLLKAQQLQPKSPRLNLGYNQQYLFNSPFGAGGLFELFKKDSNFLQINAQGNVQYNYDPGKTLRMLFIYQSNSLMQGAVDTNFIISFKKLPDAIDVNSMSVGLQFDLQRTDYKFNPRRGSEVSAIAYGGIKRVKKNNDVVSIKAPGFVYASLYDSIRLKTYQFTSKFTAAHYFTLAKFTVLKLALNGGAYFSPQVFRNEQFMLGGFKLLRGFDEESIYSTAYLISTFEFRQLIGRDSYLFSFVEGGYSKNKRTALNVDNNFLSGGLGIVYETKAGLLNLGVAIGKRNDIPFSLRQAAKIHFGYVSYF